MMIITIIIIITKITMMIRGETGGTHPHSSPVIRRPSKLSWHLTERTVTLCSQCDSVTLCSKDPLQYHCTLNTTHCTNHASDTWRNGVWHFFQRLAHCTLCTVPKIRWWNAQHTWQLSNCCFTKNKYIFNTGWQDDALLHSWEHYI